MLYFPGMFLLIGIVVYAAKLNANVWYWNTTTVAALLAVVNCFVTCIFQREYRNLRREETQDSRLMKGIRDLTDNAESWGQQDDERTNLLDHGEKRTDLGKGLLNLKESSYGIKMQTLSDSNKNSALKFPALKATKL
jgi:hypothetical protein